MKQWQKLLQDSYRNISDLQSFLRLDGNEIRELQKISEKYPICIPSYYLHLIDADDRQDPVRKMCVPDLMEFSEGGKKDTSGESENTVIQGMQHKYRQTALILSTNQCSMYCRHCFRKRMVGLSSEETVAYLPEMAEYVGARPEINNVLISGGDAFLNSNQVIEEYLRYFSGISHLRFIRFGTRTPVTLPQRITQDDGELTDLLTRYNKKKQIMIVTQFNHPKELTEESYRAVQMLRESGCIVRNQTVLLKGVNDRPDVLAELMNGLVSYGIMPYYVFQCRPVEGVKNQFQVPFIRGIRIVDEAKALMCGPAKGFRYVLSHPTGKIEILDAEEDGSVIFKYHQAKYDRDQSRIFRKKIGTQQCWLGEIDEEEDAREGIGDQKKSCLSARENAEEIGDEALVSLFFDIEKLERRYIASRKEMAPHSGQYYCLLCLWDHGTMEQNRLAEVMGIRSASLSELIGKLEAKGMVERKPSDQDRRTFRVSLTGEGLSLAEKYASDREKTHYVMVSRLSPEEKEKFYHLLSKIKKGYLRAQEHMQSEGRCVVSTANDKKE